MKKLIINLYSKYITFYLKLNQINVGRGLISYGKPIIKNNGKIEIGNNVTLHSHNKSYHAQMYGPVKLKTSKGGRIIIRDNSRLNGCCLSSNKFIKIGNNCLIAANTQIIDSNGHQSNPLKRQEQDLARNIIIEDNVWIGLNCIILKGICIGENSIIGAGSVITKNVPKNCIVAGNPAKIVKMNKNE